MFRISKKNRAIKFLAVIVLLIFLHFTGIAGPAEEAVTLAANPILQKFYALAVSARKVYNTQTDKRNLSDILEKLEKENSELIAANAKLRLLEEENEVLRQHLNFESKNDYNFVLANVISKSDLMNSADYENLIIIDKGAADGINTGQAVLNSEGMVAGKIAGTEEHLSKVYLATGKKCKLASTVLNSDKTAGIAEGDLGLTVKMNFIPQTESINMDDIVVTSGLEEKIPRGLVIGKISEVIKENNEVWQTAVVEPMAGFNSLTVVSVLAQ